MDKLNILWTSADVDTAEKMVFMYAYNAKMRKWWDEITVIIWGGSAALVSENEVIQKKVKEMIEAGVHVSACKACADQLGAAEKLESMGIEVKYWGEGLTQILKEDAKLITI